MKKHNELSSFIPKILLLIGCVFLAGCSAGSSSDLNPAQNDPQVVTSEGDMNGNGLADAIEASIAERYSNPTEYQQAIHTAQSIWGIVNSNNLNDALQEQSVRDFAISASCLTRVFEDHYQTLILIEMEALESDEEYIAYETMVEKYHEVFDENRNLSGEECV